MSKAAPAFSRIAIALGAAATTVAVAVGAIHLSNVGSNPLFRSEPSQNTTSAQEFNAGKNAGANLLDQATNKNDESKSSDTASASSKNLIKKVSSLVAINSAPKLADELLPDVVQTDPDTTENTAPTNPDAPSVPSTPTQPVEPEVPNTPDKPVEPETPSTDTVSILFAGVDHLSDAYERGAAISYVPEKVGYRFVGWYLDEALSDGPYDYVGANWSSFTTLYPKWEKVDTPTEDVWYITYDLDGGKFDEAAPETYSASTAASTVLPTASREGYTFIGWMDIYGNIIWDLSSQEGDIILEAVWAPN